MRLLYAASLALLVLAHGGLGAAPGRRVPEGKGVQYSVQDREVVADQHNTFIEANSAPLKSPKGPKLAQVARAIGSDSVVFVKQHRLLTVALFIGIVLLAWSIRLSSKLVRLLFPVGLFKMLICRPLRCV